MLAMKDIDWHCVAEYFPEIPETPTSGFNLIGFSGDDEATVPQSVHDFVLHLQQVTSILRLGHTLSIPMDMRLRMLRCLK